MTHAHQRRTLRALVPALLALATWAPAQTSPYDRTHLARPLTRVPLEALGGRIAVRVEIGSKGPFSFALDLASKGDGTIDRRLARKLRLLRRGASQDAVPVAELHLGGATLSGLDLHIVELDRDAPVDGSLGRRALRDVLAQVDRRQAHLLLYRGQLDPDASDDIPKQLPDAEVLTLDAGSGRVRVDGRTEAADSGRVLFDPSGRRQLEVRRTESGHLLVHPRIDRGSLGWFVFDTGASTTTINNRVARGAELASEGRGRTVSQTGAHLTRLWRGDSLSLGTMTIDAPLMTGLDMDEMARHVGNASGVLGGDVIEHCVAELDVTDASIRIHPPGGLTLHGIKWHEIELSKNVPILPASFAGQDGSFLLDTGDPGGAIFFTPTVLELGLLEGRKLVREHHAGVGGGFELWRGWFESVRLGEHALPNIPANFSTTLAGMLGSRLASGSLGAAMLDRFTVILDYPGARIALLPHEPLLVGSDVLDAHCGTYGTAGEIQCVVRAKADQLLLEVDGWAPAQELIAENELDYRLPYGLGRCSFVRNRHGQTTHLRLARAEYAEVRLSRR